MEERIQASLKQIEQEEHVKIFYACESGSRAWGFPSPDSDYDVRFLYVHPTERYLSYNVERKRDVIERPIVDDLDINGWDLRKALYLFRKSNPPLMEWLVSPIVYREEYSVAEKLRELSKSFYSPKAGAYHYHHLAKNNYREYLRKDEVKLKKYFYVLRPLLAIRWLEQGRGVVPTEFAPLVEQTLESESLKKEIVRLVEIKSRTKEIGTGARVDGLNEFIEAELERFDVASMNLESVQHEDIVLNELFRGALAEIFG